MVADGVGFRVFVLVGVSIGVNVMIGVTVDVGVLVDGNKSVSEHALSAIENNRNTNRFRGVGVIPI